MVTKCVEAPDMSVNNRTRTIFFNTKGDRKGLTERQIAFLDYVDGKGASDEFTAKLEERVKFVKMDSGKKADFMTWQQELIEQQEIGKEIGKDIGKVEDIIEMLKDQLPLEKISKYTQYTVEQIREIGIKHALL